MAHVREENERRSIDCSGAKVNDRSANVGSFLEQRREEPKPFDKRGNSQPDCLRRADRRRDRRTGFAYRFRRIKGVGTKFSRPHQER